MTAAHLLSGPDSYRWKGNQINYIAAHHRVYSSKGKATNHLCPCGAQAHEWAYQGGCENELIDPRGRRYSPDPDRYEPMCRKCHRALDRFERQCVA